MLLLLLSLLLVLVLLLLLSMLLLLSLLLVLVLLLLLLGMLLLLSLLLVLVLLLLPLGMLLLLSLLLLGVLLLLSLLLVLLLLLSMLLLLGMLLLGMLLLSRLLLGVLLLGLGLRFLLRVAKSNAFEEHEQQKCCAYNSHSFHKRASDFSLRLGTLVHCLVLTSSERDDHVTVEVVVLRAHNPEFRVVHEKEPRAFAAWLRALFRHDWVVYSKRPFRGPEHALRYLCAYTHRVPVSG